MKTKFIPLTLLLVMLVIVASIAQMARAQDAAPRQIVVTVKRFSYDPDEITLKKGQLVVLVLKSADVAHGLRFRDFNINITVTAHGTAEAKFTPDKTGDFIGQCSVFCGSGHGSLMLKLHVVE